MCLYLPNLYTCGHISTPFSTLSHHYTLTSPCAIASITTCISHTYLPPSYARFHPTPGICDACYHAAIHLATTKSISSRLKTELSEVIALEKPSDERRTQQEEARRAGEVIRKMGIGNGEVSGVERARRGWYELPAGRMGVGFVENLVSGVSGVEGVEEESEMEIEAEAGWGWRAPMEVREKDIRWVVKGEDYWEGRRRPGGVEEVVMGTGTEVGIGQTGGVMMGDGRRVAMNPLGPAAGPERELQGQGGRRYSIRGSVGRR